MDGGIPAARAPQWTSAQLHCTVQVCARRFHLTLLPALAAGVHRRSDAELTAVLERVLHDLDADLLGSSAQFAGCSACLAIVRCVGAQNMEPATSLACTPLDNASPKHTHSMIYHERSPWHQGHLETDAFLQYVILRGAPKAFFSLI